MQRAPTGIYTRDTWDWMASDAIFAHTQIVVVAGATVGAALFNNSTAGEKLNFKWVFATCDNAANFRLIAAPVFNLTGSLLNPQVSYLDVIEGMPPAAIFGIGAPSQPNFIIHQTPSQVTEFSFPRIELGSFVKIPSTWGLGVNITAGASNTTLSITWFGQFITETDIHTGAAVALAARG